MPDNPVVEVLAWIFGSFWRFAGVFLLVTAARGEALVSFTREVRK